MKQKADPTRTRLSITETRNKEDGGAMVTSADGELLLNRYSR